MFTVDEYRARYARSSSRELLDLLSIDQQDLTPAARQALAEETARRGLTPGMSLIESGDAELDRPRRFIYPRAPFAQRFGAYVVDMLIACGPVIMAAIANHIFDLGTQSPATRTINYLATVAWALYYSYTKDARPNGQSIGKKLFGLMVVNTETDGPCTLGQSIGRGFILSLLNGIPVIGMAIEPIAAAWNPHGRRFGDRLAGTQVVRASVYDACRDEAAAESD